MAEGHSGVWIYTGYMAFYLRVHQRMGTWVHVLAVMNNAAQVFVRTDVLASVG